MARKKSTTKSKKTGTKGAARNTTRKKEVFGLVIMVTAALMMLALITYTPTDNALSFDFDGLFDPRGNQAQNALGLIGAQLAKLLVPGFFGYMSLIMPGLLVAWGYLLFRRKDAIFLPVLTPILTMSMAVLGCIFGWFGVVLEADLQTWAGGWGLGIAGWMTHAFGATGAFVLLLLTLVVTILLLIDRDIQQTLDRFENGFSASRTWIQDRWHSMRNSQIERKDARQQILAERREAAASARKEKEAEKSRATKTKTTRASTTARVKGPTRSDVASPPVPPRAEPPKRTVPPEPPRPLPQNGNGVSAPSLFEEKAALEPEGPAFQVMSRLVEEEKADELAAPTSSTPEDAPFEMPTLDLLDDATDDDPQIDYDELEENKQILLDKLANYKIEITAINAIVGPTVTLYELTPAPGVKISRITSLEDDLAMALAARGIRMIAPIPGKSAIGVEIPNRHRELIRIRDTIGTAKFRDNTMELPLLVGKSIEGEVFMRDLVKMPHILIAGATGSGKSVGLNTFITGLLYACPPSHLKFVMIDPKKIELQPFSRLINHYIAMPPEADDPIITDVTKAMGTLKSCEKEMEQRYDLLSKARVRGISDYNKRFTEGKLSADDGHRFLPYIVVIVDELADLMMTAGKEIEGPIARLAQMARAIGIHLILATQRPSVDVITGLIKANFPARIAFQVASKIDSRTILDQNGAQSLVGNGDLLYMRGSQILRLQGPFVSIGEVDEVTHFIGEQPGIGPYILPPFEEPELPLSVGGDGGGIERDDLFGAAARIIVRSQQGSVSLLQRKLSVGYARAARIVDQLEDAGIVGPFEGSKARQVLVPDEISLDDLLANS